MATCAAVWSLYNECNATLNAMVLSASEADGVSDDPSSDPCATQLAEVYGLPLHVGAVLIVFLASLLGAGVPLLTKYHPGFAVDPYVVALGKCMGTGVVLACALVHMLQPASASLTSLCVPTAFNTDYTAYAFLFAMLAALAMQFMEFTLSAWLRAPTARSETPMPAHPMLEVGTSSSPSAASSTDATTFGCVCDDSSATASPQPNEYVPLTGSLVDAHALLLQAIMIEIGVTVHSIFIVSVDHAGAYVYEQRPSQEPRALFSPTSAMFLVVGAGHWRRRRKRAQGEHTLRSTTRFLSLIEFHIDVILLAGPAHRAELPPILRGYRSGIPSGGRPPTIHVA